MFILPIMSPSCHLTLFQWTVWEFKLSHGQFTTGWLWSVVPTTLSKFNYSFATLQKKVAKSSKQFETHTSTYINIHSINRIRTCTYFKTPYRISNLHEFHPLLLKISDFLLPMHWWYSLHYQNSSHTQYIISEMVQSFSWYHLQGKRLCDEMYLISCKNIQHVWQPFSSVTLSDWLWSG